MGRVSARVDKVILGGLAATLVFAALAHGAVEPWYLAGFELLAVLLGFLSGLRWVASGEFRFRLPAPAWPMLGLLLLGLIQSVGVMSGEGRVSLSLDPEATRSTVIALVALIIVFVVAANYLNTASRLTQAAYFLTFYGFVMAALALVSHFADGGILTAGHAVRGPFVNRNHFAGHLEMILPMPVAFVIANVAPGRRLLLGFTAVVIGAVCLASLSRGGMVAVGAEMLFLLVMTPRLRLSRRERQGEGSCFQPAPPPLLPRRGIAGVAGLWARTRTSRIPATFAVVLFVAGIVAAGLWIDHRAVISRASDIRLGSDEIDGGFFGSRGWLWRDTVEMIRRHPITGVGLGAYGTAHPKYALADCRCAPEQAHSDYLQILADAGVIGGALALTFLALTLREVSRAIRSDNPLLAAVALGCGTGIVGLLIHSATDFNLQLPSNSYLFLLLVAATSSITLTASETTQPKAITSV
jgi:O-antigen ligase